MREASLQPSRAFEGYDEVLPLKGFSGAAVAVLRTAGSSPFVRKAAQSVPRGAELREQVRHLVWLRTVLDGVACVPQILGDGEIAGKYYYDMTFVPSRDANAYLQTAPFTELPRFAEQIEALMRHFAVSSSEFCSSHVSLDPLKSKLSEIQERTAGAYSELLEPLGAALAMLDCYSRSARPTAIHGDLTFENILVSASGDLWLIDPIRSPVQHYWLDWAKLFQDCEGQWHAHRGKTLPLSVSRWLRQRWLAAAIELEPEYASRHYLLLALTFARILPYARTPDDRLFVSERVRVFGEAALNNIQDQK